MQPEKIEYGNRIEYLASGKLHRLDGPAVEHPGGPKYWYLNDQLHREHGPAIEYSSGFKKWYFNGQMHREDGPAIIYKAGRKRWFINGIVLSESEFQQYLIKKKIKQILE